MFLLGGGEQEWKGKRMVSGSGVERGSKGMGTEEEGSSGPGDMM